MKKNLISLLLIFTVISCTQKNDKSYQYYEYAEQTLDSIYKYYSVEGTVLLRETYPFKENHRADYLSNNEQAEVGKEFAYLWPYSGSLSALTAVYEVKKDICRFNMLNTKIIPGINMYKDSRYPLPGYSSYINAASISDRFYDDNVWLGLDFVDLYIHTHNEKYLEDAKEIWRFLESGTDDVLGNGIYWCEQNKVSKNSCSNAPGSVFALKLYQATNDSCYLNKGMELYEWTKTNLEDKDDHLYFDNININGNVDKHKYAYNTGQMIQAASLLYIITNNQEYLIDAQNSAESGYDFFFREFNNEVDEPYRLLNKGNIWFTSIMLRGYIELYNIDKNNIYINTFIKNLEYAWINMRDKNGLFNSDWAGEIKDDSKWLLTQFAMVEMYARINNL